MILLKPLDNLCTVDTLDNMATPLEDQVLRRKAFERDHPEWKITTERMGWVWKAQRDGSETLIMSNDLRDLLDELERGIAPLS